MKKLIASLLICIGIAGIIAFTPHDTLIAAQRKECPFCPGIQNHA